MRLSSPYRNLHRMKQYKASLHNHTISKGRVTAAPHVALSIYRLCGVPVVAVTDHDRRLTPPGTPVVEDHVAWRDTEWQHSYEDALLIQGYEASFPSDHVNVLGCWPHSILLAPGAPGYVEEIHRRGAFTIINHPAKWNETPAHVIDDPNLSLCQGMEIYNGARVTLGAHRALATTLWDACLSSGLKHWGLAGSDCHRYDFTMPSNPRNGWNILWMPSLAASEVFTALKAGRFYASSGLEVQDVTIEGGCIHVRATGARCIRFIGRGGALLQEVAGTEASYTPRDPGYVRVELDGHVPPFAGADAPIQAWLQPIWVGED